MPNGNTEGYKDELKHQRTYARDAIKKNERAGTMTKRKRAAYGKTIRTADKHTGPGPSGSPAKSDAAKNFLQGLYEMTLVGREQKNLSDIEEKTRR